MAEPSQETSQGNEEKIEKLNQTDTKEGAEEKNEENNFDMSDEAKNVKPTDFSLINYEKHKRKAISHDLSGSGSLMTHKTPSSDVITCFLCNKMVEGKFVHALGRTWHPEHFHCAQCKNPILGVFSVWFENKPQFKLLSNWERSFWRKFCKRIQIALALPNPLLEMFR